MSNASTHPAGSPPAALASPFALPNDGSIRTLRGPVLLASDGRSTTDAAAIAARTIAERIGTHVEVIAVLQSPVYPFGYGLPALPHDVDASLHADLHDRVRRRLEPVLGARTRWHLELRQGDPARTIAAVARERGSALIVIGSGGHRLVDRLLGEEISLQVVRHADVPVLAVAPQLVGPIRRAVVGVDFSAASVRAAMTALALLEPNPDAGAAFAPGSDDASSLTLVHVRSILETTPPGLASWTADYEANVMLRLSRLLDLLRPYVPAGVTLETHFAAGDVVQSLEDAAARIGADLVAVGTHGPDWMERLFVGSIATGTLRHAGRSVLVSPTPSPAERVRTELRVNGQITLDRPDDYVGALDAFTRRNLHRLARLEISGPRITGFAVASEHYRFHGASYDPRDGRVQVMLGGDADRGGHLTHSIADVRAIEIVNTGERGDRALLVDFDEGSAVLTFVDGTPGRST